jgi:hypothetical protein
VPTNHGLGPDDGQRVYCARNETPKPNKHQTVEIAENKFLRGSAPQHIDLLPENQDLRSSRALERNKPVSADYSSMRTSAIAREHHSIRLRSPTV